MYMLESEGMRVYLSNTEVGHMHNSNVRGYKFTVGVYVFLGFNALLWYLLRKQMQVGGTGRLTASCAKNCKPIKDIAISEMHRTLRQ